MNSSKVVKPLVMTAAVLLVIGAGVVGRWTSPSSSPTMVQSSNPTTGASQQQTQAAPGASQGANSNGGSMTSGLMAAGSSMLRYNHTQPHIDMALTQAQIAVQNQDVQNLLQERALTPKILPDGTKQFTLTASVFPWNLWLGKTMPAWGYNGQVAGPLIRLTVGDRVEIVVHNHLPEATTVHWHGLAVPNVMDGVPNVTQKPIPAGGTYTYRFTATPQMVGTHYYHSHYDDLFQVDSGLYGPLIVDPVHPTIHYDVDALYVLSSWNTQGTSNTEDAFAIDGKPYPNSPVLHVKLGQTVRMRLINASGVASHTMQLDGYPFKVIAIDGDAVANPQTQDTIALYPGETADIAFTADRPGKWMFYDHILSQTINPNDDVDNIGGIITFVDVK